MGIAASVLGNALGPVSGSSLSTSSATNTGGNYFIKPIETIIAIILIFLAGIIGGFIWSIR